MKKRLISIVTPVFNEEDNIHYYYDRLTQAIEPLSIEYNFEFIITDNSSSDESYELLVDLANKDNRLKIFRLSKNYGYQKSIWTGYCQSNGDAVIELDCDLQDPPELLIDFIKKWSNGYKIVYGIRSKREENFLKTQQIVDFPYVRKIFYKLINLISDVEIPENAGDFILIDRCVVDIIKNISDPNIYLRGTIFSIGFSKIGIPYERKSRINGATKFYFGKSLKLAMDGIISQSVLPLKISSIFGIFVTILTILMSVYFLVAKTILDIPLPDGFTTTIVLILLGISMNALFLGIIGEYIGRIYQKQRKIPITIIEKKYHKTG